MKIAKCFAALVGQVDLDMMTAMISCSSHLDNRFTSKDIYKVLTIEDSYKARPKISVTNTITKFIKKYEKLEIIVEVDRLPVKTTDKFSPRNLRVYSFTQEFI